MNVTTFLNTKCHLVVNGCNLLMYSHVRILRQDNLLSQGLSPPTSISDQARAQDDRLDIDILSRSIKTQKKNEADIRSS